MGRAEKIVEPDKQREDIDFEQKEKNEFVNATICLWLYCYLFNRVYL